MGIRSRSKVEVELETWVGSRKSKAWGVGKPWRVTGGRDYRRAFPGKENHILLDGFGPIIQTGFEHDKAIEPLAVMIYSALKENELSKRPDPAYLVSVQDAITEEMRAVVVDWLVDVCAQCKFCQETLFLAVDYFDRYLSLQPIMPDYVQLVAVTCLFIACKYEEIYTPELNVMVYMTAGTYRREQIICLELEILEQLDFKLTSATVWSFLRIYQQSLDSNEDEREFASLLIELSLLDIRLLEYLPSVRALAAAGLAMKCQRLLNGTPCEPELPSSFSFAQLAGDRNLSDVSSCMREMLDLWDHIHLFASPSSDVTAIPRKYGIMERMRRLSRVR